MKLIKKGEINETITVSKDIEYKGYAPIIAIALPGTYEVHIHYSIHKKDDAT